MSGELQEFLDVIILSAITWTWHFRQIWIHIYPSTFINDFSLQSSKTVRKGLRVREKLLVMFVLWEANPVSCFPLLSKCSVLLHPSVSGVTPHVLRSSGVRASTPC